jgi:hypothetical protein
VTYHFNGIEHEFFTTTPVERDANKCRIRRLNGMEVGYVVMM